MQLLDTVNLLESIDINDPVTDVTLFAHNLIKVVTQKGKKVILETTPGIYKAIFMNDLPIETITGRTINMLIQAGIVIQPSTHYIVYYSIA